MNKIYTNHASKHNCLIRPSIQACSLAPAHTSRKEDNIFLTPCPALFQICYFSDRMQHPKQCCQTMWLILDCLDGWSNGLQNGYFRTSTTTTTADFKLVECLVDGPESFISIVNTFFPPLMVLDQLLLTWQTKSEDTYGTWHNISIRACDLFASSLTCVYIYMCVCVCLYAYVSSFNVISFLHNQFGVWDTVWAIIYFWFHFFDNIPTRSK